MNVSSSLVLYFLIHFALNMNVIIESLTEKEIDKNNCSKINDYVNYPKYSTFWIS